MMADRRRLQSNTGFLYRGDESRERRIKEHRHLRSQFGQTASLETCQNTTIVLSLKISVMQAVTTQKDSGISFNLIYIYSHNKWQFILMSFGNKRLLGSDFTNDECSRYIHFNLLLFVITHPAVSTINNLFNLLEKKMHKDQMYILLHFVYLHEQILLKDKTYHFQIS